MYFDESFNLMPYRHDDLKPSNVMVHNGNILLTDFGFWYVYVPYRAMKHVDVTSTNDLSHSLDSSDSGVTTTTGPPSHSTRRYSAPEVFNHGPRSRLTDIWSLGCILSDIVSRLLGHRLDTLKTFWETHGAKFDSYAENPSATATWLDSLANDTYNSHLEEHALPSYCDASCFAIEAIWLIGFIKSVLLEPNRLSRPTAGQILERLTVASRTSRLHQDKIWVQRCCLQTNEDLTDEVKRNMVFQGWPTSDVLGPIVGPEVSFFDLDLRMLGKRGSSTHILEMLHGKRDFFDLQTAVRRLLLRNHAVAAMHTIAWPKVTFEELVKSWYISCPYHVDGIATYLRLWISPEAPRYIKVRVVLFTAQLERTPTAGVPFIAVMYHLEGSSERYFEHDNPSESEENWENTRGLKGLGNYQWHDCVTSPITSCIPPAKDALFENDDFTDETVGMSASQTSENSSSKAPTLIRNHLFPTHVDLASRFLWRGEQEAFRWTVSARTKFTSSVSGRGPPGTRPGSQHFRSRSENTLSKRRRYAEERRRIDQPEADEAHRPSQRFRTVSHYPQHRSGADMDPDLLAGRPTTLSPGGRFDYYVPLRR